MSDLSQETANAIKVFVTEAVNAKEFCVQQAPDVINQMLAFGMASSVCAALVLGGLCLLCAMAARRMWIDPDSDSSMLIIAVFGFIVFSLATAAALENIAKIHFAPKIYVIEKIAKTINQGK